MLWRSGARNFNAAALGQELGATMLGQTEMRCAGARCCDALALGDALLRRSGLRCSATQDWNTRALGTAVLGRSGQQCSGI